jgi:protein-disulfide isomerase
MNSIFLVYESGIMICVIAMIVFGILGIFSASYRVIAKEAFNCVFKKITLRKCDTGLDTRLKSQITGKLLKFSPRLGKSVYKHFEIFSWIFLIITIVTLFFMGQGIYFYAVYGNCNGPQSDQFCIFDPLGTNKPDVGGSSGEICSIPGNVENKPLVAPSVGELVEGFYIGNPNAEVVIIAFGCYACHYTKIVEPTINKVIKKYDDKILYVYKDFPLSTTHINALRASEAAHCALDQDKYWEYREYLFANQDRQFTEDLVWYASELGLDVEEFKNCLNTKKYQSHIEEDYAEGINSGITVTPTFFINDKTVIGAQDFSEFQKIIDSELGIKWWQFWK